MSLPTKSERNPCYARIHLNSHQFINKTNNTLLNATINFLIPGLFSFGALLTVDSGH